MPQRVGLFLSNPTNQTYTLTTITEGNFGLVGAGDFDTDGKLDFLNVNEIYYGRGDGSFTAVSFGQGYYLFNYDFGYLNDDNRLDIVEVKSPSEIILYLSSGVRTYGNPIVLNSSNLPASSVYTTNLFDVNNDNLFDLIITGGNVISVFTNNGNGSFSESFLALPDVSYSIMSLKQGDFNKDGHIDFVVGTTNQGFYTYLGDGQDFVATEIFVSSQKNDSFHGLEIADLNNDNLDDIISFSANPPFVVNFFLNKTAVEPTAPPSDLVFSERTDNSFVVNVTPGDGDGMILIVSKHETLPDLPMDPSFYSYDQGYGAGAEISPDAYVCYIGFHESQHIQSLEKNTTYYVYAFEYNTNYDESEFNYLTSQYAVGSVKTKDTQTISAGDIPALSLTESYEVEASASSSLPVSIEVVSQGVTAEGLTITPESAGPKEIILTQAGDDNFMPAESVHRVFCVNPPKPVISSQQTQDGHRLTSSSDTDNHWYLNGEIVPDATEDALEVTGAGTYTVVVDVDGCSQMSEPLVISDQTITFEAIQTKEIGQSEFQLIATTTSDLEVSFRTESNLISISGTSVSILAPGTVTIEAYQDGNNVFTKAESVFQTFCVNPEKPVVTSVQMEAGHTLTSSNPTHNQWFLNGSSIPNASQASLDVTETGSYTVVTDFDGCSQTSEPLVISEQAITFETIATKQVTDVSFVVTASSTSELPVSFRSESDKIIISDNAVTIVSAGSVTIEAYQNGSELFTEAESVFQTFCINPSKPTISQTEMEEGILLTSSSENNNEWYFNGEVVTGQTSQTLLATENGTYSVRVKVDNCSSQSNDEVVIVTSVAETSTVVNIWPIPVSDILYVEYGKAKPLHAELISLNGSRTKLPIQSNYDLSNLASGLYFLKLDYQNSTRFIRFIKQ